jgi:hypothetical protein
LESRRVEELKIQRINKGKRSYQNLKNQRVKIEEWRHGRVRKLKIWKVDTEK